MNARIALVGDFDAGITAHRAIDASFRLADAPGSPGPEPLWLATDSVRPPDESVFQGVHGVWCVPASPYRSAAGALWAIRFARTRQVPFLGTCGGFQHALLEYARNVLGLAQAAHAEDDPQTAFPLLSRMRCALVEESERIRLTGASPFRAHYGADTGAEVFHCRYGLNPELEHRIVGGPLKIVARGPNGEARAAELSGHPFFIATLFQPERRALTEALHPLVAAFFRAAARTAGHAPLHEHS